MNVAAARAALVPAAEPLAFACAGDTLYGLLHLAAGETRRGVVLVVGGPQTRVGSHRQFVLLARALAARGFPVLRFDYRGMGDSEGAPRDFERIDQDLRAAVDELCRRLPGVRHVALWGLCDAATAIAFYAATDPRVDAVVLLNPWVRSEAGAARATLEHYYLRRLFNPEAWRRLFAGALDWRASWRSLRELVRASRGRQGGGADLGPGATAGAAAREPLAERMRTGLERYPGAILLISSGNDLTAAEFKRASAGSRAWRRLLRSARVSRHDLPDADHTFSRAAWRETVERWTGDWLESLPG